MVTVRELQHALSLISAMSVTLLQHALTLISADAAPPPITLVGSPLITLLDKTKNMINKYSVPVNCTGELFY